MERKTTRLKMTVMLLALVFFPSGCASTQNNKAINQEQLLASAGFRKKLADTQEKLDHLKDMPQRKLFQQERDGKLYYVYADTKLCKCLYFGNKEAYESYQQILLNMKLKTEDAASAAMYRAGERDWEMWGTWLEDTP